MEVTDDLLRRTREKADRDAEAWSRKNPGMRLAAYEVAHRGVESIPSRLVEVMTMQEIAESDGGKQLPEEVTELYKKAFAAGTQFWSQQRTLF